MGMWNGRVQMQNDRVKMKSPWTNTSYEGLDWYTTSVPIHMCNPTEIRLGISPLDLLDHMYAACAHVRDSQSNQVF